MGVYISAFVAASHAAASAKFLDFVEALLTGRGAMSMFGKKATTVWIIGVCIWLVVFILGMSRHFCGWPQLKGDDYNHRSTRSGRLDRTDPLLPPPMDRPGRGGSQGHYDEEPLPSGR